MRVLIAPDKFAGTLTSAEAARAIADGWARHAPDDHLDLAPVSDGGPGFVDALHAAHGGEIRVVTVAGPLGQPTPAATLMVGETAYIESASACGLHLMPPEAGPAEAEAASSAGVGECLVAAVDSGVRTIVVGVGGTATTDGGRGLLEACDGRLPDEVELVVATDVDSPLTGLFGAAKTFGPQKGIPEERLPAVDAALETYAATVDRRLALAPGAGAGGGIGFALLALGARRVPGLEMVADALALMDRAAAADLVVTGEGAFDFSSRAGKVPAGVAALASEAIRPCVVLAGDVHVGSREMRALGIESAYSMVDLVGRDRALHEPATVLSELAARVARTWSA